MLPTKRKLFSSSSNAIPPSPSLPTTPPCVLRTGIRSRGRLPPSVPHCQSPATLRPIDTFSFSPFGAFCQRCKLAVCVRSHHVKHPELDFAGFTLEDFIQFGARRINALRANADLSKFVVGASFSGYACARCDVCFCRKDNAMKHTAARNNNCKLSDIGSCAIFETVCGRTVQASKILAATVPCGATVPLSTTRDWLDKYMADDEKADRYIPIFHPMSQHGNGDKVISDFIDLWTKEPSASEPALLEILELGRIWLLERVRLETGIVHANYRAAIMVFEGQDEGDVKQNTTYNFRHNANALLPELLGLLKFAWRRADQWGVGSGLSGFKQSYDKVRTNPFLVAQILHTLFVQNIQNFYQHPIAVEYCLSRCFRKRAALLSMVKCDLSSTQVAGVLSLLRAGTCGFLLSLNQHAQQIAPNACRLVRTGAVMNTLCPFIRTLKEMHAAKNTKRMKTVSPEGNIAVDGFLFKESIWSELIPRVFDECKKLLTKLLAGNHWLPVLESSIALTVDLGSCRSIGFQLRLADGTIINSTSISVVPVLEAVDLDRLASFLSIAFFGLGCGAMRGSELKESFFADANWHRNTFYYTSQPTKTYSSMAPTTHKKVEHKLPSSLARCFLLFRYILNSQGGLMDLKELVPTRVRATHSMKEAITEVFNFDQVPNKTQIRHFFTSLTDVIFPDSNLDGALNAVPEVAEMSGHSHVTHRVSYPTIVFDGRELIYSKYHLRLGVDCSPSQSLQLQTDCLELTKTELLQSLRILAGPTAEYLSVEQEQMVSIAASTTTDHAHVGLPCGGGKSMAWMVPAVARVVTQRSRKTIIVVLPYKFLSAYHLESATRLVKGSVDLDIVSLTGQDIGETSLPGCLTESNLLPHILFLSLEALQNLMRHHGPSLTDWVNAKQIHRFVVDEIHTIYSESFRPVYEQLPGLVRFGAPVMTMSGTVPRKMVPTLLRHLGMSSDPSFLDVDVVECVDAVGSFPVDFRLNVNNTPSFPVAAAVCILELLRQRPDQGIHVVASSKSIAQKVVDFLEHKCDSWRYVTSETPKDELDSVAKDWSIGSFNVLVSTSIALVGNENKKCHHVFVVGYLFNLMSVVQAIGRLRPLQRTGSATVQFWVNQWKNDRLERADEFNSSSYENLKARKLITDVDKSLFLQVASIRGLHKWLFLDQGCRLQNLAIHFGTSRRGRCGICDVCCGTVTRTLSAAATTRFEKHNGIRNKAMVVLKALLESCLYCQRESCEGEGCMKNLCYRCGSPKHFTRQCLDGKTAEDLLHARACYHCFDLYNRRGYSNHNSSDCPLKRRLRRMVFAKWPATTTTYKSFLSSNFCSEEAFCSFVASLGTGSEKKQDTQVRQLICHQVVDVPGEPLLLPDRQVQVGCEMDIDEARNWNTYYQSLPKSSRRHRKFVFGAIYQHFYPGFYEVDHMTMGDVDLVVFDMSTQTTSVLKIRSAAADVALMEAIVTLGECMPKGGNCRKNAGDLGQMYALGYRSKKMQKVYVQLRKKTTRDAMTDVCTRVLPFLKKEYPEVLSDIQTEERSGLKALMPALEEMGGEEGPGGSIMLSRNLGNSSHFDTSDNSFSCSIWGEKHQRRAESWYFVLPNMSFNGSSGIVIRLRHGVAISWDGRIHRHCSSVPDPGPDNNVYGCMFGSCRG